MLDRMQESIFLVLVWQAMEKGRMSRGTAFGIRPDLLVTCEHVVRDASQILIVSEARIFSGKRLTAAEIATVDKQRDLALLKVAGANIHPLELSTSEELNDAIPLLLWTWPGWNGLESKLETAEVAREDIGSYLSCVPRAAVMTRWWPAKGGGIPKFSFAGHVEEGMSGGPILSALTGEVVGVVCESWLIDPTEVAENWRANVEGMGWYDFSGGLDPAPDEIVEAQLGLGMGIALPVQELNSLMETFPL